MLLELDLPGDADPHGARTIATAARDAPDCKQAKGGEVICTFGIWTVKAGREDDFSHRWEESASKLSLEFPDVTFRLLRTTTIRSAT